MPAGQSIESAPSAAACRAATNEPSPHSTTRGVPDDACLAPARREAEQGDAGRVHLGEAAGGEQHLDVGAAEPGREAQVAPAEPDERAHRGHRLAPQLAAAGGDERAVGDRVGEDRGEVAHRATDGSPGTGTHLSPSFW